MNRRALRIAARTAPFLALAAWLAACGSDGDGMSSSTGGTSATTAGSGGGGASGGGSSTASTTGSGAGGEGTGGSGGEAPMKVFRKTIQGDATWNVTFDADAKAAGATDCTYSRHYEGVEDRSAPWLCPSCEVIFRADVQITKGLDDCFPQISMMDPAKTEWLGYGGGTWWRSPEGPMTDQGLVAMTGADLTTTNEVVDVDAPSGGKLGFSIDGHYTVGEAEGDPMNGWVAAPTYTCGWSKSDPPPYTGDYTMAKDGILPDGLFKDACDEVVRLHDFKGDYLVVEMSARDCPPCQQMAGAEEAFVADMAAKGIKVHVVTLLAPSLTDVYGTTTKAMLAAWIKKFKLTSPVLADRSFGVAMFGQVLQGDALGYPSWTVVRPDLTMIDWQSGFGTFDDIAAMIEADAK